MGKKIYHLVAFTFIITLFSCNNKPSVDTSSIVIEQTKINRLEQDIFTIDTTDINTADVNATDVTIIAIGITANDGTSTNCGFGSNSVLVKLSVTVVVVVVVVVVVIAVIAAAIIAVVVAAAAAAAIIVVAIAVIGSIVEQALIDRCHTIRANSHFSMQTLHL